MTISPRPSAQALAVRPDERARFVERPAVIFFFFGASAAVQPGARPGAWPRAARRVQRSQSFDLHAVTSTAARSSVDRDTWQPQLSPRPRLCANSPSGERSGTRRLRDAELWLFWRSTALVVRKAQWTPRAALEAAFFASSFRQ